MQVAHFQVIHHWATCEPPRAQWFGVGGGWGLGGWGGSCLWPPVGAFLLHMCLIFSVCLLLHQHKAGFVCPPRTAAAVEECGAAGSAATAATQPIWGPCNLGHMRRLLEVNLGCGQECCQPALSAYYAGTAGSPSHPEVVQHCCKRKSLLGFGLFGFLLSSCWPNHKITQVLFKFSCQTYCPRAK